MPSLFVTSNPAEPIARATAMVRDRQDEQSTHLD
jgi:hypothetical protein